jgi:hypothetical protein
MSGKDVQADGGRAETRNLFVEHPALGVTLGYLVISLLGLSYEWTLFRHFGINYFHYAEVTDFLMGAFREPITLVLSLTALMVGAFVHYTSRLERWLMTRRPPKSWLGRKYRAFAMSRFSDWTPVIFFVGYSVMFVWIYADNRAEEFRGGDGAPITVEVVESGSARPPASSPTLMLGTSSRFIFVYRPKEQISEIIPHENIARIVVRANEAGAGSPEPPGAAN